MIFFQIFFSSNKNQNDEFTSNTFYKMAQGLVLLWGKD